MAPRSTRSSSSKKVISVEAIQSESDSNQQMATPKTPVRRKTKGKALTMPVSTRATQSLSPSKSKRKAANLKSDSDGDSQSAFESYKKSCIEHSREDNEEIGSNIDSVARRLDFGRKSKNDAKESNSESGSNHTVYLEDLNKDAPLMGGSVTEDGVYQKILADRLLQGTYQGLPKLAGGKLNVSWKEASDPVEEDIVNGMMKLSKVAEYMPGLDIDYIKSLITFDKDSHTNVINFSRIDPSLLVHKRLPTASSKNSYKYIYLRAQQEPALAISLICVDEDYTKALKSNGGPYESKIITGTPLSLEYERMVATLCMVMDNTPFIRTQISENRWTFSTRPLKINKEASSTSYNTPKRQSRLTGTTASPATAQTKASALDIHRVSLNANDDIPVFDGRHKQIDLPRGIRTAPRDLPPFTGAIPFDSLVLIGYSAMSYKSIRHPNDISVAFNAVWVVVLGVPEDSLYPFPRSMWYDDDLYRMLEYTRPLSLQ